MTDTHKLVEDAIALAAKWQNRANQLQTSREKIHQRKWARLSV